MGQTDRYENPLSTQSAAAREAYDTGVTLFLGGNYGAVAAFTEAVTADEGFAVGHAALARARMMDGDMPGAKASISTAKALATGASPREQAHVTAVGFVLAGQPKEARRAVMEHVRTYPRDAMVAQMCCSIFGLIGFSGEVGREAELLAYTSALMPHYGDDWWMLSMHALSLCETGQVAASHKVMDQALAANPRNANGAHFKAHAHYEAGETAQGRAYLDEWMGPYDARSVLYGHMQWHRALWALQDGDEVGLWAAVDSGVGPNSAFGLPINILTDTAAILYRAELAGIDVAPERWSALSDYAARTFPDPGQSFVDMHAALSHAMAGQGERLATIAETAKGFAGDLVRPVAKVWSAVGRGDWTGALADLLPIMGQTERLGGSRAQRDLLELTYLNVLMKLGQTEEAARALAIRRPALARPVPLAAMS